MDFNHISRKLTQEQVNELTNLYHTYHKQYWCYKKMFKKFKRMGLSSKAVICCFYYTWGRGWFCYIKSDFLGVC